MIYKTVGSSLQMTVVHEYNFPSYCFFPGNHCYMVEQRLHLECMRDLNLNFGSQKSTTFIAQTLKKT